MSLWDLTISLLMECRDLFLKADIEGVELKKWTLFNSRLRKKQIRISHCIFYCIIIPIIFLTTLSLAHTLPIVISFIGTIFLFKIERDYLVFIISLIFYLILPFYRIFQYGEEITLNNSIYFFCMLTCFSNLAYRKRDIIISSFLMLLFLISNNFYFMNELEGDIDEMHKALKRFKTATTAYFIAQFFLILIYQAQFDKIIQDMWITQAKLSSEREADLLLRLSHELQNPLNILNNELNFTMEKLNLINKQFIEMNTFTERKEAILKEVKSNLNHIRIENVISKHSSNLLSQTISNILDHSKIEAGELEFRPAFKSFKKILTQFWDYTSYKLNKYNLNGSLYIDTKVPEILKIDSHFILTLLLNIKTNAIKYSEGEEVQTVISWINEENKEPELLPTPFFLNKYKNHSLGKVKVKSRTFEEVVSSLDNWNSDESIPAEEKAQGISPYNSQYHKSKNDLMFINSKSKDTCQYIKIDKYDFLSEFSGDCLIMNTNQSACREKGYLKIEIYDSGPGISNIENLFDKNCPSTSGRLGLGLGLWVIKEMCKMMDAEIKVFTEKGYGSQFVILIPVETISRRSSSLSKEKKSISEMRVLIVDDDLFNREICKKYLHDFGIKNIVEAQNGQEAYEKYKQEHKKINMIFMDLEMPIMGGKKACEMIRKFEKKNNIVAVNIVIASGNSIKSEKEECLNSEGEIKANLFISKPLTKSDFAEGINLLKNEFGKVTI